MVSRLILKRAAPYVLMVLLAIWTATIGYSYLKGRAAGKASLQKTWEKSYSKSLKSLIAINADLKVLQKSAAIELEAAVNEQTVITKEVIRYVEKARADPAVVNCVFGDDYMRLYNDAVARTRTDPIE